MSEFWRGFLAGVGALSLLITIFLYLLALGIEPDYDERVDARERERKRGGR